MKNDDSGRSLRQLFQDVKRDDAQQAPDFEDLLNGDRPWSFSFFRIAGLATAVAAVFLLSLPLWRVMVREQTLPAEASAQQWKTFSNWEPASDALLAVSSAPWTGKFQAPSDALLVVASPQTDSPQANL